MNFVSEPAGGRIRSLLPFLGAAAFIILPCSALRAGQVPPAPVTPAPPAVSVVKSTPPPDLLAPPVDKTAHGIAWPALSPDGKNICFTYLGDLWTVPSSGGTANRLTVHEALDADAHWSPDGKWIAFTSLRTGNADIFIVPFEGGTARQVTLFGGADWVTDWTADGQKIIFYSQRDTKSFNEYSIDLHTRALKRLTTDEEPLRYGTLSPDGKFLAYSRSGQPWWRPWYRGSVAASVVVEDLTTHASHTPLKSNAQQFWPLFSADGKSLFLTTVYGDGNTPNLWKVPVSGGEPKPLTHYTTDAVRYPAISRNGSLLAFVYQGDIYTVHPNGSEPKKVNIIVRTDDKVNNQERQVLTQGADSAQISPDGKQVALTMKGAIWTMPIAGGDAQRLTEGDGNYNDIAWSPDSTRLALISDRGNQPDLYVMDVKTKKLTRLTNDSDEESDTHWSPDGKYVSFAKAGSSSGLYIVPSAGGDARRLAEGNGNNTNGNGINSHAWSSDSKWLAFSRMDRFETRDIWIVPSVGGNAINVTRYPGYNGDPQFTHDGRHLLFVSNRSTFRGGGGAQLFQLPLEKPEDAPAEAEGAAKKPEPDRSQGVKIDFDDIHLRAQPIPQASNVDDYAPTPDGHRVVFETQGVFFAVPITGGAGVQLSAGPDPGRGIIFLPDASRFYYTAANGTPHSLALAPIPPQPPSAVGFSAEYIFDHRVLYQQAFNEFYRRFGTNFYDPKMHGVAWSALRSKYETMLEGVGTPEEFSNLLSEMVGEVNSSHSEIGPASKGGGPQQPTLGLFYDWDYAGPGLKVASVMPHSQGDLSATRINPGDYILSIDGTDVSLNEDYYRVLQDKEGKKLDLLVNSKPSRDGAHSVKLKPISIGEWARLEYEARVHKNREMVSKLSGGRLAYIHIQAMNGPSLEKFQRELWSEGMEKDGLVLDIRGNGGGNTHDRILEDLSRHIYAYTQPRDGLRQNQPQLAYTKPVVLLIDQNSYSDAEIFPAGFRALHLGKIVGVPTPGYVIGTYEGQLVDGTHFRVPTWGYYTAEGKNMENLGIAPDMYVENTPEEVSKGKDHQLETAVEVLLKEVPSEPSGTTASNAPPSGSANDNPNGGSSYTHATGKQ